LIAPLVAHNIVIAVVIGGNALPKVIVPARPDWKAIVVPGAALALVMAARSVPADPSSARLVTVIVAENALGVQASNEERRMSGRAHPARQCSFIFVNP
jgi:hypothetical protein